MGMIGNYFRTDGETVNKVKCGELSLVELCYEAEDSMDSDSFLYIDKSWHAIHFVLSGEVWDATDDPLSKVVLNGNIVNDEDMGYGPAMLLMSDELHDINKALEGFTKEWFLEQFSITDMIANEIYPVMNDENGDDFFEYIYHYFTEIVDFLKKAEQSNQCVLFFVN